jgi:hypothetical protein
VLAVGLRFPTSERLGGAYGQAGIGAEIVEQAIGGQAPHIAAIPPGGIRAQTGEELHLGHGERVHPGGHVLAGELDGRLEGRHFRGWSGATGRWLWRGGRGNSGGSQDGGETAPVQTLHGSNCNPCWPWLNIEDGLVQAVRRCEEIARKRAMGKLEHAPPSQGAGLEI